MKTILLISSLFLVSVIGLSQSTEKKGAIIVVDKEVHDFGSVVFGSSASCEFVITNTGVKPLIITSCKGSCGCTVPEWSKEPIAPGATGSIRVKYDTKRPGPINKSITILSNATNDPTKIVRIKGNVNPAPDGDAPVNTGGPRN
jgi:hypothetical protein